MAWVTGNLIRNNTVQMRQVGVSSTPDKYGIYSSWQDGIVIENNTVSGAYNTGIYVANSSKNYIVRHNEVFNVGGNGIHNNGAATRSATSSRRSPPHHPAFHAHR